MLIQLLEALDQTLTQGLYERLLQGKIREAKETIQSIYARIKQIQTTWTAEHDTIPQEKVQALDLRINKLVMTLTVFCATAQHELATVTNEDFARDPETWKLLFASTFEPRVHEIGALLRDIDEQLVSLRESERKEIKLPSFSYTLAYQKRKGSFSAGHQEMITNVERSILERLARKDFRKDYTDKILTGQWKDRLHSRLKWSLSVYRIVYVYKSNHVLFEMIGTKKELGLD